MVKRIMTVRDRGKSSVVLEELAVEPLPNSGGLGISFRCLPDASLTRCSGHVPPGGGPGEDPGHTGGTISLSWPGNTLGSHCVQGGD